MVVYNRSKVWHLVHFDTAALAELNQSGIGQIFSASLQNTL